MPQRKAVHCWIGSCICRSLGPVTGSVVARRRCPRRWSSPRRPRWLRRCSRGRWTAGVPARWVTADEAYGQDHKFRSWLEQHNIGYVVAVPRNQSLPAGGFATARADHLVAQAPAEVWKRRSAGDGAKGPRLYDWAVATVPTIGEHTPDGWVRWLLVRSQITPAGVEPELAYYLCCAPATTTDEEPDPSRRCPLGDRGMLPNRENRGRSRPLPGPPLRRLVPAHHPGHARPHLPRRHRRYHPKSPSQRPYPAHPRRDPPSTGTRDQPGPAAPADP